MRVLLVDPVNDSGQRHRLAIVVLGGEGVVRHSGNGQHDQSHSERNKGSLHGYIPPKMHMISVREWFPNEAETDVADTERGTKVVITFRHPKRLCRVGPAASRARHAGRCETCIWGRS